MRGLAHDPGVIGTRKIALAGSLHLDHACAQVGELACAERGGNGVFQRDDGDAVEGTYHEINLDLS